MFYMTPAEILRSFVSSGEKRSQITVLAELNDCSEDVITHLISEERNYRKMMLNDHKIPESEWRSIRDGKRSVADIAKKYDIPKAVVSTRYADWYSKNGEKHPKNCKTVKINDDSNDKSTNNYSLCLEESEFSFSKDLSLEEYRTEILKYSDNYIKELSLKIRDLEYEISKLKAEKSMAMDFFNSIKSKSSLLAHSTTKIANESPSCNDDCFSQEEDLCFQDEVERKA